MYSAIDNKRNCEMQKMITSKYGRRTEFTSIILRDLQRLINLSGCCFSEASASQDQPREPAGPSPSCEPFKFKEWSANPTHFWSV